MSPIFLKSYSWSEDLQKVYLTISIPGASIWKTDIFITDKYIKINHAPYLWELFLKHTVDHISSRGKVGNGVVEFTLIKLESNAWLEAEESMPDDKQYLTERRKAEVVKIQNFNSEIKEKNAARRQELNSSAIRQQIKLEKEEKERIQNKMAADKMEVLNACFTSAEHSKECQGAVTDHEDYTIRNSGRISVKFTPKAGVPVRSSAIQRTL